MDEYSGIETLLGLPVGSTKKIDPDKAGEHLAKGVNKRTTQLNKELKKTDTLEKMSSADLVKCGITLESLERDKETIRKDTFELYRVGKVLLDKYMADAEDRIDMDDRMYTAGFKGIDSLSGTLDKLGNMILKFKQDEQMNQLTLVGEDDDGKKEMNPRQWMDFVEESKKPDDEIKAENVQDAEIVESSDDSENTEEK